MTVVAALKSRLLSSEGAWSAYARHWARRAMYAIAPWVLRGEGRVCPCCGGHFRHFANARALGWRFRCPRCGSLARHRVLWLYLERETDVLKRSERLLQFAPDWSSYRRLSRMADIDYLTGDIQESPLIRMQMDIAAIPLPDNSVDVVLCSHVLEHVPDDRRAMREIHRILKPSGVAFLQHPIVKGQSSTDEDPGVVDPHQRQARWGQADHVRAYGTDYYDRLGEAGFDVQVVAYQDALSPAEVEQYGLTDHSTSRSQDIAVCRPVASHAAQWFIPHSDSAHGEPKAS